MSTTNVKVKAVVKYTGMNLTANGAVTIILVADYSEMVNAVQVIQMISNDITVAAKLPSQKAMKLGVFQLNNLSIDHHGDCKIKLKGLNDFVEMDNINKLPLPKDDDTTNQFQVLFSADIDDGVDEAEDVENEED